MKTIPAFKSFAIVFTLLLVILFTTPNLAQSAYSTGNPVTDQLLDLAQEKLNAEHKALISGKAEDVTASQVFLAGKASEKVKDVTDLQLKRNKILAEHGQKYTKYTSTLTVQNTEVLDDSAKITAKENVTLTLIDKNSTEPVFTKEEKTHVFHFTRQGNKWIVTEDAVADAFRPALPEEGGEKITDKPVSLEITGKSGKTKKDKPQQSLEDMVLMATSGTYNPGPAVNYARSYWNNYNTAYRTYGNDCTNFTSQALNWGGWQHKGGWYSDANYWWYSPSAVAVWGGRAESRSWINVHYFYFFARYSGRAYNAAYISDFTLGDTLQIDFGTADGTLDHNTIVTKDNGNGNIFLTYHSNNTLDISIWDVVAKTPGAAYYGTLFNYFY
jgi:hypothetical protein